MVRSLASAGICLVLLQAMEESCSVAVVLQQEEEECLEHNNQLRGGVSLAVLHQPGVQEVGL